MPVVQGLHVLPASKVELADGVVSSWIQLAKAGTFFSKKFGKIELTTQMFKQWVTNAKKHPNELHVDYEHHSTNGEGEGIAAGWIQDYQFRENDTQLWGLVEWTEDAVEKIRAKKFRYISPTFVDDALDHETGQSEGSKLMCAALTNLPFLKGMAPVSLSEDAGTLVVLADASMSEKQQRIAQAFYDKYSANSLDSTYIVDFFDDHVIVNKGGKLFRLSYSISDDLVVAFADDLKEVIHTYTTLSETPMPDPVVKPGEKDTTVQLSELTSMVETLGGQVTTLSANLAAETEARKKAEKELSESRANTLVDSLIAKAKLSKKQEAWAKEYAIKDFDGFKTFSETLEPIVAIRKEHGSGEGDVKVADDAETKDAVREFSDLCAEYIKENGGPEKVKYADAMRAMTRLHPGIATRYREAFAEGSGSTH